MAEGARTPKGSVDRHPFSRPTFDFNEAIAVHACSRGGEPAFIDGDRVLTWREFDQRVTSVARTLMESGIQPGERVALLAENSFWAYEAMFGIFRAGAVITPLSTLLPATLKAKLLEDSGARLMLAGQGYEQAAKEALASLGGRVRLITEGEETAASKPGSDERFAGVARDLEDTFTIIYSSGTTGTPKGIMHSVGGRLGLAWQFGMAFAVTARTRSLIATPPSSNGTMIMLLPTMYAGGTCILRSSLAPDDFFVAVERQGATHAFLVPTQFKKIFDDERISKADLSGVRCLLSVGAPMPADLKRRVLLRAKHCFHEAWGFTEGVATVIYPGEVENRLHSVGRPLPGTELRLIDADGRELEAPATGEIVGRSIMMMQGYLNRPDANADIRWSDREGTVFLRTGDIGEIDADGFLTLRGRIKDMIISGGLNVYPVDIEAVLLEHPQVEDAAVVGIPDERWGEVPVAFVIPKQAAQLDPEAVQAWTNERVSKHQRLKSVVVHAGDFPRNALGKVLKNELQKAYSNTPREDRP